MQLQFCVPSFSILCVIKTRLAFCYRTVIKWWMKVSLVSFGLHLLLKTNALISNLLFQKEMTKGGNKHLNTRLSRFNCSLALELLMMTVPLRIFYKRGTYTHKGRANKKRQNHEHLKMRRRMHTRIMNIERDI